MSNPGVSWHRSAEFGVWRSVVVALLVSSFIFIGAGGVSAAGSGSWVADVRVNSPSVTGEDHPDVAALPNGTAIVVWADYSNPSDADIKAQLIDPAGNRLWTNDLVVSQAGLGPEFNPRVATGPAGDAVVVWTQRVIGQDEIFAQKIGPDGKAKWGMGDVNVSGTLLADDSYADVATNGDGTWVVVWGNSSGAGRNILAQRLNASGAALWAPSGVQVNQVSTGDQAHPHIARNSSGGSIISWIDDRLATSRVFAQALNATGVPLWGASDVRVDQDAAGNVDWATAIALGPGDTTYVTWAQPRTGMRQIFGQRLDSSGSPQWGATDKLLAGDGSADLTGPDIAVDTTLEAGELMLIAEICADSVCSDTNITARRLDALGNPLWAFNLTVNQYRPNHQTFPSLAYDPVGMSHYVVWADDRNANGDIWAQHFDEAGVVPEAGLLAVAGISALIGAAVAIRPAGQAIDRLIARRRA